MINVCIIAIGFPIIAINFLLIFLLFAINFYNSY